MEKTARPLSRRVCALFRSINFRKVESVKDVAARTINFALTLSLIAGSMSSIANARFISPDDWDPTKAGVGTNRYAYSENDPINKSDPSGHQGIGHNGGPPFDPTDLDGDGIPSAFDRHPGINDKQVEIHEMDALGLDTPGAALGLALGLALSGHMGAGDGLTNTQRDVVQGIDNRISNTLNEEHYEAVRAELDGKVVATKANGVPYDHVTEVREAVNGQIDAAKNLQTALGSPSLAPEARGPLTEALSKASKSIDDARKALSGESTQNTHDKGSNRGAERSSDTAPSSSKDTP